MRDNESMIKYMFFAMIAAQISMLGFFGWVIVKVMQYFGVI